MPHFASREIADLENCRGIPLDKMSPLVTALTSAVDTMSTPLGGKLSGATILSDPQDAHGHRRYRVADPEGHPWWFVQPIG